ncbi:hypothetical protein CASFOL_030262 [Castilleja foliolosa]|uniref:Uncharacterized protein n=1 Tax=Castilleja foliolosa TaxID=1961234 RepID=A0ABD3C7H6_9LAMI
MFAFVERGSRSLRLSNASILKSPNTLIRLRYEG